MRFHYQHGHLAHQHRASSAEQANHEHQAHQHYHRAEQSKRNTNTRPDNTARKKPEQQHTLDPVLSSAIQMMIREAIGPSEARLNSRLDGIKSQLVEITSQLRLRLRTQQILYDDTQETSDDTQETNDDIDSNTNDDIDSNTNNDDLDSSTDGDVDESDSEQEMDHINDSDKDEDLAPNSSIYKQSDSSDTTGVAPNSSPSACSQIEEIKDPFVGALTKRHSLTQLHEWLKSIKSSVNKSSIASGSITPYLTSQLIVIELSLKSVSTQLNDGHHLAWSGYAKYENFKPWKTKQSFHPRHSHCWFASLPQLQQIHFRSSNRLRNKPCTKPVSARKCTTTANHRRMRQSTQLS